MTGVQKTMVLLNNFGVGLLVPILSLFLLSHGCDLQSLAIVIGIYSATVILAEVPSGLFADTRGRKRAFFLSCAFVTASLALMYFSRSVWLLIIGMVLFGLGRAFLSGSLDSLIIEDCIRRNGEAALPAAAGANLVYQGAGIAAGSLVGGFLPNVNGYALHILVRVAALLAVAVLCAVFLRETPPAKGAQRTLIGQARLVTAELKRKRLLRIILLCIFGGSLSVFALETYWQPQFSALILPRQHYLLGIVCTVGYAGNMLGSFVTGRARISTQSARRRCYLLFLMLVGAALCMAAVQRTAIGFLLCYALLQTALGVANVPEQTLLNGQATDATRASLLSVASLFMQIGGVFCALVCSALVLRIEMAGVLLAMGAATVAVVMAAGLLWRLGEREA